MARTRSAGLIEPEVKMQSSTDEVKLEIPDDEPPPPSTFNGRLSKFEYKSTSTSTSTTTRIVPQSSLLPPPKTLCQPSRSPKRRLPKSAISNRTSSPLKKTRRKPSTYAPPSTYSHLSPLSDILAPGLIAIFIGTNPGLTTASRGHAYAHPSNHFWKLLHTSGLTPNRRLAPEEDGTLPAMYGLGNTNIVARPSRDAAELSRGEMVEGAGVLEEKVRRWRPEAVCVVGKGIWEAIWRWKLGRGLGREEFRYGWQDEGMRMGVGGERAEEDGEGEVKAEVDGWKGARVYVTTSTSGLAASLRPAEKEAIWKPFGEWVCQRRRERGFVPGEGFADVEESLQKIKVEEDCRVKVEDTDTEA